MQQYAAFLTRALFAAYHSIFSVLPATLPLKQDHELVEFKGNSFVITCALWHFAELLPSFNKIRRVACVELDAAPRNTDRRATVSLSQDRTFYSRRFVVCCLSFGVVRKKKIVGILEIGGP